jgi:DNA-binding response OmpR family regulator
MRARPYAVGARLSREMTKLSFPCHLQVIRVRVAPAAMQILVIEDEPRILAFLARGLEAEGFRVDGVESGPAGLQRALAQPYDAVVLDLLLPGLDGLSVLRELHEQRPDLPVVIVSARSDLPTKLRGFGLGASDYLAKPFALDELVARVRVQLRRNAPRGEENVVRVGTLTLDLARRQARIGTLVADLSDREFRLLHHLVEHAGTIVSRERLLSEVWGYHFDPGSNVVEVCVRRLRKKLGEQSPIETVRHAGYRLRAA